MVEDPFPNGNRNSLGIILRDVNGDNLWAAMGPARGMTKLYAILWGAQADILAALSLGFHKAHIETDNWEAYDTIRVQEFIILPPDLEQAFSQFDTLYTNQFHENLTARKISIIPLEFNSTEQYMATYGIERMVSLVIAPRVFGNSSIQYGRRHGNDLTLFGV